MNELNISGCISAIDRFASINNYSLTEDEEKMLSNFFISFFGREDYFIANNKIKDDIFDDFSYMFDYLTAISFAATNIATIEKRIFCDKTFTHQDFYNVANFFGYLSLFTDSYIELLILFAKELETVSLPKILQKDWSSYFDDLSEVEIYDELVNMELRDATMILERVDCSYEVKNTLKESVINKDEDAFIKNVINSRLDLQYVSAAISIKSLLKQVLNALRIIIKVNDSKRNDISWKKIKKHYEDFVNEFNGILDEQLTDNILGILQLENDKDSFCIPNIGWDYMYRNVGKLNAAICGIHQIIKNISFNIDVVCKLEKYIQESSYFKSLNDRIISGEVDLRTYELVSIPLSDFRDKFLFKLNLPDNVLKGAKRNDEYLESNRAADMWYCTRLYQSLVKANFLYYDEDTYYSFICRMSRDYKGKATPIQIVWLGKPREIYYLINWFCDNGASKMWHKTASFFSLADGTQLKEKGVLNQAKSPTPKISNVISEIIK